MNAFKEFIEAEVKLISAKTNPSGIAMIWKDSATTREDIDKLMSTLPSKLITFENYMYTIRRETWQIVFKRVISSLLSSYNSTARSITNSSIEDTNSIIEIRKYLASCLLEVIFSVIVLGESMDVSYPPEYIKSLEDKYFKGIPSIVMFMHSEKPSPAQKEYKKQTQSPNSPEPQLLNNPLTNRAKKYFQRAVEADYMEKTETGYKWRDLEVRGSKAKLAYFLHKVYNPDRCSQIPYKGLNTLLGVVRLDTAIDQVLTAKKPQKWRYEIDKLFND